MYKNLLFLLILGISTSIFAQKNIAEKPLFRDPVQDGAADPVIILNRETKKYVMFYTNRRAKADSLPGVSWVHGTKIGYATSKNGKDWTYEGTANFEGQPQDQNDLTFWAPDVIYHDGIYHMYVTIVPGVFEGWYHPRYISHYTSKNLKDWTYQSDLDLSSKRCIDAYVFEMQDGTFRMYYNNENDNKSIYFADSKDLYHWEDSGKKVVSTRGEGAVVFQWKDTNWMIIDSWNGLSVFQSDDLVNWKKQEERILEKPGTGKDDKVKGGHADVIVQDGKAYIFYFTHPERTPENKGVDEYRTRRSSIQVAELQYENGKITCDRDQPVRLNLKPKRK